MLLLGPSVCTHFFGRTQNIPLFWFVVMSVSPTGAQALVPRVYLTLSECLLNRALQGSELWEIMGLKDK